MSTYPCKDVREVENLAMKYNRILEFTKVQHFIFYKSFSYRKASILV